MLSNVTSSKEFSVSNDQLMGFVNLMSLNINLLEANTELELSIRFELGQRKNK